MKLENFPCFFSFSFPNAFTLRAGIQICLGEVPNPVESSSEKVSKKAQISLFSPLMASALQIFTVSERVTQKILLCQYGGTR